MGAAQQLDIHGAKGGSTTPKSPTEATDSLRSTNLAKILIAVGEGEFDGVPTAKDIYLDNTPIEDVNGNVNFPNVQWEWRSGSVEQSYIPGIPSVENETTVNVELRNDAPWVRSITNVQLSAARVRLAWPALQQQDDEGNVGGYRIEYAIDIATDGGAYQQVLSEAVDGKTTTRYERSRRVDLPAATTGWQIRVRRITANQNTNKVADTMLVAGLTEVIDKKLRYPNTALLYIEFDAEQFTNIPAVTVDCKAKKWQVPSNYDPVARTYTGVWDGTFKEDWTNNAAWITFGVCTEDRFGLGKRIKPFMVDKWELYRIAQYCDVMVSNGVGGQEPLFLCDMNIQGKSDAWGLLRDISAIYRGMTYWAQGQLVMQADMPRAQDFDYVFTRSNVIDGKFSYGSASSKTRYTRAIVSYDNPANNYDTDVVAYSDLPLQRRFGDKPVEISAIGCTRASEAQRRGKWVVLTNNFDRTVSFKTGMEGAIPLPGYIIPVADSLLAGREIGGRISAVAGRVVTLDRDTQAKAGDRLIVNLPSGKAEARTVQSVAGRAVTVTTAYSETPVAQLQWAIDADDLAIPLYRVMSTKRTTEGDYEITALQYEPSKFAAIDTGARLEERPISVIPITVVPAPASVTLTSTSAVSQGIAVTTMTIAWPPVSGAVAYDVEWRKDNGNWISVQRTGMTNVDITGIYSGGYLARVRAVSAYDITSIWKSSNLTQLNGKEGLPPAVTSLTTTSLLFGIGLKWTFPAGAEDTQRTEIWYSQSPTLETATKLADLSYPQSDYSLQQLKAAITLFFWARLVDRSGNVGPWYPAGNGVAGQTSSDADAILDLLVGEITESQLGQELLSDIQTGGSGPGSISERLTEIDGELIDLGNQSIAIRDNLQSQITSVNGTLTSVKNDLQGQITAANGALTSVKNDLQGQITAANTAITATNTALNAAKTNLQSQIDAVNVIAGSLPYKASSTYTTGKATLGSDGIIYQATQNVPINTPPPNTTYWLNIGQAAAAGSALSTRVQTLETRATSIEGVNSTQATQITGLTSSVANKADASAVTSLNTRVTTAEGNISSQGNAITGLTNTVAGKADSTTVTNLTNTVTQQGTAITAQGTAITGITASLGDVGGQNLFYNPSLDYMLAGGSTVVADGWGVTNANGSTNTPSVVASTLDPKGKAQRIDLVTSGTGYADLTPFTVRRPSLSAGQNVMLSAYVRGTAGIAVRMYMQPLNAAGATLGTKTGPTVVMTGEWLRIPLDYAALPANTASMHCIFRQGAAIGGTVTSGFVEWDRLQLQLGTVVTGWQDNTGTISTDVAANATATTALTGRVATVEGSVTSQGTAITTLTNNVTLAGGQNLLPNPSLDRESTTAGLALGWRTGVGSGTTAVRSLVASTLDPKGKAQRLDMTGLSTGATAYVDYALTGSVADGYLASASVGQVMTMSGNWRATVGLTVQLFFQWKNAAGGTISTDGATSFASTGDWQRGFRTAAAAPVGTVAVDLLYRVRGATATAVDGFIEFDRMQLEIGSLTGWRDNNSLDAVDLTANAAATTALTTRVTSAESTLSTQSGQITTLTNDVAGKASSATVAALDSRVTTAEGNIDSQGSAITNLTNTVAGKADASALNALTTRVTSAEGTITSQGNSITGLTSTVNNKADASAVTALTTRVTATESKNSSQDSTITSQGTAITNLQNALPGKADASAVTALTTRVSNAEGTLSSQGSAITSLTNTVNGKADASTVTNLSNTVTAQGNTITAQGTAITGINATLANIGGEGANLIPAEYSSFTSVVPSMAKQGVVALAVEADSTAYSGYLLKASTTTSSTGYLYLGDVSGTDYNLRLTPNGKYIFSFWAKGSAAHSISVRLRFPVAGGGVSEFVVGTVPVGTDLARLSVAITASATLVSQAVIVLYTQNTAAIGDTWFDGFMLEQQVGTGSAPSNFIPGPSTRQSAANATATTALTGRVTTVEGTVSTQSNQITALTNNLTNSGGDNLLPNSSFEDMATTLRPKYWQVGGSASWTDSVPASPLTLSTQSYRATSAAAVPVAGTLEIRFNTAEGPRPKVTGGNTYTLSSFIRGSTGGFRISMYIQFMNAAGTVLSTPTMTETLVTDTFTRYTLTGVAPALAVSANVYAVRIFNRTAAAADMFVEVDNVQFQEGPVATAYSPSIKIALDAQSAATAALTSQVTQQGTDITSASTRVTNLENSVNNATTGLATKASSAALDSLTSTVTTQGTNITSATNRVTTLENSVNNASTGLATKASSTALNSLSGTVTTQGNTITSQGTAITNLANTVNSTTDGLATKASAAALTAVTSRVTAVEGVNTSQSTSITNLTNSINSIQGDLNGSELDAAPGANWNFDGSLDGWFGQNASVALVGTSSMRVTASTANPIAACGNLSIVGGRYNIVRAKITRRTANAADWNGILYYATPGHGVSSSYYKASANPNIAVDASAIVEWDMSALTAGGADWMNNTINTLRFDLGTRTDSVFDIDWIVVGRKGPGASSQALSSLSSTVTQQGTTLTSQASAITNLNTTVGNQGAALQIQAQAIGDTAGKVSSSYTVKLQAMTDGRQFMAGFGIGLDNSSGVTQSQVIFNADTFAVLNGSADLNNGGRVVSPFVIEGGQVFMSDAVIKKATITNAIIGSTIYSQTFTSYGQPVMTTDYNSGMITIQNKATQGRYMFIRDDGIFMVSGGVVMVELSLA
jgi:predicted phage tail protein/predicted  nucleic acid-binding Zn-ribbon protein